MDWRDEAREVAAMREEDARIDRERQEQADYEADLTAMYEAEMLGREQFFVDPKAAC